MSPTASVERPKVAKRTSTAIERQKEKMWERRPYWHPASFPMHSILTLNQLVKVHGVDEIREQCALSKNTNTFSKVSRVEALGVSTWLRPQVVKRSPHVFICLTSGQIQCKIFTLLKNYFQTSQFNSVFTGLGHLEPANHRDFTNFRQFGFSRQIPSLERILSHHFLIFSTSTLTIHNPSKPISRH